jgi:hypothetical protein
VACGRRQSWSDWSGWSSSLVAAAQSMWVGRNRGIVEEGYVGEEE